MNTADNYDWAYMQELVNREILLNVSGVVSELRRTTELSDEAPGIDTTYDYQSAVRTWLRDEAPSALVDGCMGYLSDTEKAGIAELARNSGSEDSAGELIRSILAGRLDEALAIDIAWDHDVEPYERETLEHWAVTDWMVEKLQDQGETVEWVAGLNVWCRTTSGQAIVMDNCIKKVADAIKGREPCR